MFQPFPLSTGGRSFKPDRPELNIAFRFWAEQSNKMRACDDLGRARTNLACVVETPIRLVSWGHLTDLKILANAGKRDWALFKADREASYKQLPMRASHAKLAVVARRSPADDQRYGLISRTMMFGAIAAFLHYNALARLPEEQFASLFGIPLLSFFDDYGAIAPSELAEIPLHTVTLFCEKLGIKLKIPKSEFDQKVTFLGLGGGLPCRGGCLPPFSKTHTGKSPTAV